MLFSAHYSEMWIALPDLLIKLRFRDYAARFRENFRCSEHFRLISFFQFFLPAEAPKTERSQRELPLILHPTHISAEVVALANLWCLKLGGGRMDIDAGTYILTLFHTYARYINTCKCTFTHDTNK